jgi:predicted lipoprotein with Yx(FWY)xxD motif
MATRVRHILAGAVALGAVLATAACGSSPATTQAANARALAQPPATTQPTGTVAIDDPPPSGSSSGSPAGAANNALKTADAGALGTIVTNGAGMTLYRFDKDTNKPPKSACVDACVATWPPATITDDAQFQGVDKAQVGSIDRPDGIKQLTIAGWPMYTYSKDAKAGDTTGEAVGGTWWVAAPNGTRAKDKVKPAPPGTTVIRAMDVKPFGKIATDSNGMTLYRFDKDTINPSVSNCSGECANTWPILKAEDNIVAEGIDKALVGSITRADGAKQLTLAGWPMYRYIKDTKVCQTNGEGVGGTWFVAAPDGKKAKDKLAK